MPRGNHRSATFPRRVQACEKKRKDEKGKKQNERAFHGHETQTCMPGYGDGGEGRGEKDGGGMWGREGGKTKGIPRNIPNMAPEESRVEMS